MFSNETIAGSDILYFLLALVVLYNRTERILFNIYIIYSDTELQSEEHTVACSFHSHT